MTNVELPEYRERTPFWRDGEKMQNFGDFLTMFLLDRLFLRVPRLPGDVRIIGSYLDDYLVRKATDRPVPPLLPQRAPLIAWAGGVRRPGGLSQDALAHVEILSVRGPLSAKEIGRPGRIPLGDPGLLLPALYTPRLQPEFQGRTLCVPHFNDFRADDAIRAATGADCVLRPAIVAALNEVEAFLDRLTSASFVLCGSLHAAIAAAAYGIPFAFWESGDIDIPFKWHDFAALVEIECVFCPDVASGRAFYEDRIRTRLKLPSMWEALAVAPYPLRPDALLRILMWDISQRGADANSALSEIEKIFEAGRSRLDDIVTDSAQLVKAMTACLTENNTVIAAL